MEPRRAGTRAVALGARVTVTVGNLKLVHDIVGVTGYLSQSDPRAHFGLGQVDKADRVEVRWPDGTRTTLADVEANRFLVVEQGARP